jgi:Predicted pPIWI-associating nuclease
MGKIMLQKPTLDERLSALKHKVVDAFSVVTLDGAQHALADTANPLRLNCFSTALRILFEHMMGTLAPDDQIVRSSWFKPARQDGKPTRAQRIVFAIQGGLSDAFVKDSLGIDIHPLRKRLLTAVDDLSKHVHGREDTIITDVEDQDNAARMAIEALENFLAIFHECRSAISDPIQEKLNDATVDALIAETIQEVDELATHHSIEEVYVHQTKVKAIGPGSLFYQANGSLSVTLQWGSNSDMRRGDGVELGESFPFECDIEVSLDDPWDLSNAETRYGVDTTKWRDGDEPD